VNRAPTISYGPHTTYGTHWTYGTRAAGRAGARALTQQEQRPIRTSALLHLLRLVGDSPELDVLADGSVRVCCQILDQVHKSVRLAPEKSVRGEGRGSPHGSPRCVGRANNRTDRELSV